MIDGKPPEPLDSFFAATLKLRWAASLFATFLIEHEEWLSCDPYGVRVQYDGIRDKSYIFAGIPNGIPGELACLSGDVVSNLRNSLDCAWMGVVRANGKTNKSTLPIYEKKLDHERLSEKWPINDRHDDVVDLLSNKLAAYRDFSDGGSEALVQLNELSNWNKHNQVFLCPNVVTVPYISVDSTRCKDLQFMNAVAQNVGETAIASVAGQITRMEQRGSVEGFLMVGTTDVARSAPLIDSIFIFFDYVSSALLSFAETFPEGKSVKFQDGLLDTKRLVNELRNKLRN